jgi:hypothetical protein
MAPQVAAEAELEPPPDLAFDVPPAPPPLVTSRSVPAKPHVAVAPAQEETTPAEKPAEPTLAPEVATEEMVAAKAEAQHNLDLVEKNMTIAWGRTLNSTQQDLISKIRGFTENTREAMRSGDWVRAKNFSKKAQVLSEQLAGSL